MLNIGVLCHPRGLLGYQDRALEQLKKKAGIRLSFCFHLVLPAAPTGRPSPLQPVRDFVVDRLLGKTEFERRTSLPNLPKLPFKARREGRYSILLEHESAALLESLQLDVLINFNNHILGGDILTIPRFGVWSYHHGDPLEFRGYPPGFWEIYHGATTTGAILQKLGTRLDGGLVLKKATFPTVHESYFRQREMLFAMSVPWLAEVADEVLSGRTTLLEKPELSQVGPIYTRPTNLELLKFLATLLKNKLRKLISR